MKLQNNIVFLHKNKNHFIRMEIKTKRNTNIELLRFVLMIAICIWHTMVHGFDFKNMSTMNTPQIQHLIMMVICVPAVDTFMFISGYYGIRFSYDKLLKLIIQAILISNIIILVRLPFGGSLSFYDQLLPISSGLTWWFLSAYAVIMILSPILNAGINSIESKNFRNILIILFFIFSIVKYRLDGGGYNLITLFLIYLLGRYCNKIRLVLSRRYSFIVWISSISTLLLIMTYNLYYGNIHSIWVLFSYNNPVIIVMAVSIFYFSLSFQLHPQRWIAFLGNHSLSIYLVSEMIGITLYNTWKNIFLSNILIFITSIFVFALLCEFVDIPIQTLNTWIRKKIIRT